MKIEKKKIAEDSKWNSAVKASVAALIGVAATSMVACSSGDVAGPEDENNRENVTPNPEEIIEPAAGDPVVGPEQLGVSSSEAKPACDSNVRLCPDPNDPENMIVSMVTTFERTDIDV